MTFLSYSIVVTVLGIAYFSFVIAGDLFRERRSHKSDIDVFDNSDMDTPTMVGDDDDDEGRESGEEGDTSGTEQNDDNESDDEEDTSGSVGKEDGDDTEITDGGVELFDQLKETQESECETVRPHYQEMLQSDAFRVLMCQPAYLRESKLVIRQVLT